MLVVFSKYPSEKNFEFWWQKIWSRWFFEKLDKFMRIEKNGGNQKKWIVLKILAICLSSDWVGPHLKHSCIVLSNGNAIPSNVKDGPAFDWRDDGGNTRRCPVRKKRLAWNQQGRFFMRVVEESSRARLRWGVFGKHGHLVWLGSVEVQNRFRYLADTLMKETPWVIPNTLGYVVMLGYI